jgi:hypothetical protein
MRFGREDLWVWRGEEFEHQSNVRVGGVEVRVNAVIDDSHPERGASWVPFPFHDMWPEERWDTGRAEHGIFAVSAAEVGEVNEDELLLRVASIGGWRRQREVEFFLVDSRHGFGVGMVWPFGHGTRRFYPHGKSSRRIDGDGGEDDGGRPGALRHDEVGWWNGPQGMVRGLSAKSFSEERQNERVIEWATVRRNERSVACLVEGQGSRNDDNCPASRSRCSE